LLEGRLVVVNRKQQVEAPNDVTTTTTTMDPFQGRIANINASPLANGNILLLDVPSLGDVSSSKVRNASNKDLVRHMLSPKVLEYVIVNKLYGFGE
jgi:nicotinic acid mononucleotide adenylyltransferase